MLQNLELEKQARIPWKNIKIKQVIFVIPENRGKKKKNPMGFHKLYWFVFPQRPIKTQTNIIHLQCHCMFGILTG